MAGVFLAYGFVVDVDLLWSVAGEGDIAQFDFVASAVTGQRVLRVIVECKGGDRWGYGDAFHLLGQLRMIGEEHAILLAAQRRSLDRQSRTASSMDRWFAPFGLHVLTVPIDDHLPAAPVIDIDMVGQALFAQGLVPLPNPKLRIDDVEACTRGIARLRGAMDRVAEALADPMGPPRPPAADLLHVVRDWSATSNDPSHRLALLRRSLFKPGSQVGWNLEALAAHPHFTRDVGIVALYAAAQEIAALVDVIRRDGAVSGIRRELQQKVSTLDLHALVHAWVANGFANETSRDGGDDVRHRRLSPRPLPGQ